MQLQYFNESGFIYLKLQNLHGGRGRNRTDS